MTRPAEREYVLGTHDDELRRLGLQHEIWRRIVLDCWRRAGIGRGSRVMDVGAGPGYATIDLAEAVGPEGRVIAIERSQRFAAAARTACRERGFTHVDVHELDLMEDPFPVEEVDAAWCRWVACFVASPARLVERLAAVVRPGGVAVFHEYVDYATMRLVPPCPSIEEFVQHVMMSWRATGGEPDVARVLPTLLADAGFEVRHAEPRILSAMPKDPVWRWPASFIDINLRRLVELGQVDARWADEARRDFARAEADPRSIVLTPTVLELIAERRAGA